MLEDPTYESIVRWGEGGESFVVLEVRPSVDFDRIHVLTSFTEREIHEIDPPEALQA
jgi:hypothetical protein